jgi:hypothetical protein
MVARLGVVLKDIHIPDAILANASQFVKRVDSPGVAATAEQFRIYIRARMLLTASVESSVDGMSAGFQCAGCGEWNEATVDESAGRSQIYVEDCQICCKPNLLHVEWDGQTQQAVIRAELE